MSSAFTVGWNRAYSHRQLFFILFYFKGTNLYPQSTNKLQNLSIEELLLNNSTVSCQVGFATHWSEAVQQTPAEAKNVQTRISAAMQVLFSPCRTKEDLNLWSEFESLEVSTTQDCQNQEVMHKNLGLVGQEFCLSMGKRKKNLKITHNLPA